MGNFDCYGLILRGCCEVVGWGDDLMFVWECRFV